MLDILKTKDPDLPGRATQEHENAAVKQAKTGEKVVQINPKRNKVHDKCAAMFEYRISNTKFDLPPKNRGKAMRGQKGLSLPRSFGQSITHEYS